MAESILFKREAWMRSDAGIVTNLQRSDWAKAASSIFPSAKRYFRT